MSATQDYVPSNFDEGDDGKLSAVRRSFSIIEIIAGSPVPLTLESLARLTGTPKSTLHRLLKNLIEANILIMEASGKCFAAGERLRSMASALTDNSALPRRRKEIIRKLVERIGHTCNFTTLAINDVVYVDRVESKWTAPLMLAPGSRVPVHCTSSGKLLLSYMPARQRRRLLFKSDLGKFTEMTVTDPIRLEDELRLIRKQAVATDDGGYLKDMISLAVPVFGRDRKIIGCVAVHADRSGLPLENAFHHLSELRSAARELGTIYRRYS